MNLLQQGKKNRQGVALAALVLLTALTGCGGGSSSNDRVVTPPPAPQPEPEPMPQTTNFTGFVTEQFGATSNATDPVQVNDLDFEFADQDNPAAFDGLLDD